MKRFAVYALPILFWMGLIFFLSSQSKLPTPNVSHFDKFAHAGVYGLLGLLLARALRGYGVSPKSAVIIGIIAASCYGASDEIHQIYTPGRTPDVFDWVADTFGASLGAAFWYALYTRRPQLRSSP
ncbi:MAG: VanZ family protein [Myxococcaceae bacterium]